MPLVVKFADTPKEKDQKKMQQHTQNLWNAASTNTLAALGPHYISVSAAGLHYTTRYISVSGAALHYTALHFTTLHITLHYTL